MKKTTLLLASLGLFLFSSCSSDDNSTIVEPQPVNHLLGAWKLNTMSIKISQDGEVLLEQIDVPTEGQVTWEYDFNEDLTVDYVIATDGQSEKGTGTYTVTDSSLTITIQDEPQTFEITTLNAENLYLKFSEEEEIQEGFLVNIEMEQKFIRK